MTETNSKRVSEKWSDYEISQLRSLYGTMLACQVGEQIGRSKSSVIKKAGLLGLHSPMFNLNEKWPDSLIETLKTRGPSMMAKAFMAEFGKTKDSVYNHAKKYKVKFLPDVFWTPARIEVIRQAGSATEAAKALGIGRDAVLRQSKRSGIVLKETRPPKDAGGAPKRIRTEQKRVPSASRRFVHEERSRIEFCPTCGCPVSDWAGHTARIGCRRQAA
jgi:hypothetical protein